MKKFLIVIPIIFIIALVLWKENKPSESPLLTSAPASEQPKSDQPRIVSTIPNPLEGTIIAVDQKIEITFSHPLENAPELKLRIEPKLDYKVELSSDRKTAKITPDSSYDLGVSYTLFIMPDSKFDGGRRLDGEKVFHFQTIRYRGI